MLVSVDWGTTRLRAKLVDAEGTVRATHTSDDGLMRARQTGFAGALDRACAALGERAPSLPVLMSGMVGARQGWIEAPYAPAPAGLPDLSQSVVAVPDRPGAFIVPGVSQEGAGPWHADVVRGEETEAFGALATGASGVVVSPGTHSKWIVVEEGRITRFRTYLTGDAFAALSQHTVLSATMADGFNREAFRSGLDRARKASSGGLLNAFFGLRADWLFGRRDEDGVGSALSGLLIGAEIADAAGFAGAGPVTLVGAGGLAERYRIAAEVFGVGVHDAPADCAVRTHLRIAQELALF